jgi:starvation-inducible DNA-binding protein
MTTWNDREAREDELQGQLRDLLCLAVVGDHLRWVVRGDEAADLADWLASSIVEWRELAGQTAAQLVASGVAPDGRIRSLAKDIPVNWVPDGWLDAEDARELIEHRLHVVTEWAYARRSQTTDVDRAALLDVVCSILDAQRRSAACLDEGPRGGRDRLASTAAARAERPRAAG